MTPPADVTITLLVADAATLDNWAVDPHDREKSEAAAEAWKRGSLS